MHIVVAGASGRTGRRVVERAVAAGHRVTALVRDSAFTAPAGVEVRTAQVVADAELVLPAGADAVVSALGPGPGGEPVCEPGTRNLLAAMGRSGTDRIVVASAVPAHATGEGEPWWFRLVRAAVRRRTPEMYDDIEAMEHTLRDAGDRCRWTILRPGYLTDGAPTAYELLPGRNAATRTHRADLAHALVAAVEDDGTVHRAYGIRRGRLRVAS